MKTSLVVALGLMLLVEGIFPFLFPRQWRETFIRITQLADGQIRFIGLVASVCGALTLTLVHFFS